MVSLYNEDCLQGMIRLPDNSVDCIICDLPYNVTACAWDMAAIDLPSMWEQFKRILKPCCSVVLFASGKFTHKLIASNFDQYKYKWIWVKNAPTMFVQAKNAPMHKFEEILIFSDGVINHLTCTNRRMKYNPQGVVPCSIAKQPDGKDKPSQLRAGGRGAKWVRSNEGKKTPTSLNGGKLKGNSKKKAHSLVTCWGGGLKGNLQHGIRKFGSVVGSRPSYVDYYIQEQTGYPSDVLNFKALPNARREHPTQKPVDLLEYLIKTYTDAGETVLDATMGSGSTGVAAVNTGRNFIGFELETKFYDIACRRIADAQAMQEQNLFKDVAECL